MSIRNKLLIALLAFSGFAACIGLYAMSEIRNSVGMTVETYNKPFMSMNFARAAYNAFVDVEIALDRASLESNPEMRGLWRQKAGDQYRLFRDDLAIARQRAPSADAVETIDVVARDVAEWYELRVGVGKDGLSRDDRTTLDRLTDQISIDFDFLFDLIAGEGFRLRQQAKRSVDGLRQSAIVAVALVVLAAIVIGTLLARAITLPVRQAVAAAERIARGELYGDIKETGSGEMSLLLKSMSRMQTNLRDIMAREEELRKSAQMRLADAIENSPEGITLLDADYRIVIANSRLRELFGDAADKFAADEMFFDSLAEAAQRGLIPNSDATRLQVSCRTAGEDGQGVADIRGAGGTWLRFQFGRARDGGIVVICTDISDIIWREKQIREAKEIAEAANFAKTEFLANMSHELRTPLNAVIGFSQILKDEILGPIGLVQYRNYAADIHESGSHLLSIINEILDLSKIEAGRMELSRARLDPLPCIESTLRIMHGRADDAGVRLSHHLEDVPPALFADERMFKQMLLNVVSNAVKFTEPGGSVTVHTETGADGMFRVSVIDTGIGMTEDEIRIAGEPFGQVEGALNRKYQGTGLGLPLSRRMAELHSGGITIESDPGVGSCVTLELPIGEEVAEAEDPSIAQAV